MCFYWTNFGYLTTKAYSKPGQKIQYISRESTHRRFCHTAIPGRVLKRLGHLTLQNDQGIAGNKGVNELYPDHWNALLDANLVKKSDKPPRMKTLWKRESKEKNNKIQTTKLLHTTSRTLEMSTSSADIPNSGRT